jgi:hypothetical protein
MMNQDTMVFLLSIYAIFFAGIAIGIYLCKILNDK